MWRDVPLYGRAEDRMQEGEREECPDKRPRDRPYNRRFVCGRQEKRKRKGDHAQGLGRIRVLREGWLLRA